MSKGGLGGKHISFFVSKSTQVCFPPPPPPRNFSGEFSLEKSCFCVSRISRTGGGGGVWSFLGCWDEGFEDCRWR